MSAIETILTRMMDEPAFADAVFADSQKALSGYELSEEQLESFKYITPSDLDAFVIASPEERKSLVLNDCLGCWGPPLTNHNETILKINDGFKWNHNESILHVREGVKQNHNETSLKIRDGYKWNHNESIIQSILSRMMHDEAFAESVFSDGENALAEYNLSPSVIAKLKSMPYTDFPVLKVEERKSLSLKITQKTIVDSIG